MQKKIELFWVLLAGWNKKLKKIIISKIELITVLIVYVLLRFDHSNFDFIWDGKSFYNDIHYAAHQSSFDFLNFCPQSHVSFVFSMLAVIPELLFPGNAFIFHLFLTVMMLFAIIAFYRIFKVLSPGPVDEIDCALATVLFAFNPVILGSTLNFSFDTGLLCFFVIYLAATLLDLPAMILLSGLMLQFTKEPGIVALYMVTFFYFFIFLKDKQERKKWLFKRGWILAVQTIAMMIYVFYRVVVRHVDPFFLNDRTHGSVVESIVNPFFINGVVKAFFGFLMILHFEWIKVIGLLFSFILLKLRGYPFKSNRKLLFILALYLAMAYLLIKIQVWTNTRYVMMAIPLFYLVFFLALQLLKLPKKAFRWVLSGLALLSFVELYDTYDPLSHAYFGSFQWGERSILKVIQFTNDCCGVIGRDQMIHNLEYLSLTELRNQMFKAIRPTSETLILYRTDVGGAAGPFTIAGAHEDQKLGLDPITFETTLRTTDVIYPTYGNDSAFNDPKAKDLYYMDFVIFNNEPKLSILKSKFENVSIKSMNYRGFTADLYHFY